jgi:hypothetical protein
MYLVRTPGFAGDFASMNIVHPFVELQLFLELFSDFWPGSLITVEPDQDLIRPSMLPR